MTFALYVTASCRLPACSQSLAGASLQAFSFLAWVHSLAFPSLHQVKSQPWEKSVCLLGVSTSLDQSLLLSRLSADLKTGSDLNYPVFSVAVGKI